MLYNNELSSRNNHLIIKPTPRTYIPSIITGPSFLGHTWNLNLPLVNPLKTQFFYQLSTNLLYWTHWACNPILLGLGYKLWPHNYYSSFPSSSFICFFLSLSFYYKFVTLFHFLHSFLSQKISLSLSLSMFWWIFIFYCISALGW